MGDDGDRLVISTGLGLDRLTNLLSNLTPVELNLTLPNDWTVSTALAHLAFWDQWVVARWRRFREIGGFDEIDDIVMDLVNEAAVPAWTALTAGETVAMALASARHVSDTVSNLPEVARAAAVDTGRNSMLDRSLHWDPHLQEITDTMRLA